MTGFFAVQEKEEFTKPGTANVSPADRQKLAGLLKHYAAKAHPFTACKKDQISHGLSEDHANRRCAVIKALIGKGNSKATEELREEEDLAAELLREALDILQLASIGIGPPNVALCISEAKLDSKARDKLPDSDFALPGRRYPIHDEAHARNALSRVAQSGSADEQAKVRAAVAKRYPNIGKSQEALEEALAVGQAEDLLRAAAELVEAAPTWMIPVAARKPGFRPLSPEKKSSTSSSEFNKKHPRGSGAQGGQFIRKGTTGSEVNAVQHRLGITRTGTFNGATKSRVEKFQKNHGLQVDGVVGRQTVAAFRGTTTGVTPGALTKNDRRYLRRYARRT